MEENVLKIDQKIADFIYSSPDVVASILRQYNYSLPNKLTLNDINKQTFKAIYEDINENFIKDLHRAILHEGYSNVLPIISLGVSTIFSAASLIGGAKQAKKALDLQKKIAMAQLSQTRLLEEERIRTGAETERTRILLNTLQQYQSDLQAQSTQRIKDVWIYTGMLGVSVAIVYGVSILLTSE